MIFVVDFGSQTAHLIARRIEAMGVPTRIVLPKDVYRIVLSEKPNGIIFSGGPSSVYDKGAPTVDPILFSLGIPILTICYGFQLAAKLLGGQVVSGKKEYGPAVLQMANGKYSPVKDCESVHIASKWQMANKLPRNFTVWMSHGDEIVKVPDGFEVIGSTEHVPYALAIDKKRNIIGLLFHPEVEHTQHGNQILENFVQLTKHSKTLYRSSGAERSRELLSDESGVSSSRFGRPSLTRTIKADVQAMIEDIKKRVGESYVIGAVSGGVDSTVAATLTARAIGKHFVPVFVDNGLMRQGTGEWVKKIFASIGVRPLILQVGKEMLRRLKRVEDPEKKRKIIGQYYIELFEKEMTKLIKKGLPVKFLLQGTIYSDVIESKGTAHASKIKSHHNVGGLPKKMQLKLLEPLRAMYKDEVRALGLQLGLPEVFVYKQPFPGPGFAVRIRGEVTKERLAKEKQADTIVLEELAAAKLIEKVFISFPVLTDAYSTAVKGDGRFFGEVVALRVVESSDIMTSTWARLPYDVLQRISSRIVNEVNGISRVVYDISTKPPATMEWE